MSDVGRARGFARMLHRKFRTEGHGYFTLKAQNLCFLCGGSVLFCAKQYVAGGGAQFP